MIALQDKWIKSVKSKGNAELTFCLNNKPPCDEQLKKTLCYVSPLAIIYSSEKVWN